MLPQNPELPVQPVSSGLSMQACRVLTGVDVGLSGAIAALSWLTFHSWLRGEFWWAKLNVAGALFYGPRVYLMGLGHASLAGFALLVVLYTGLGVLFSLLAKLEGLLRNLLLGCLLAMSWHVFAQNWFWQRLDLSGPAYYPVLATLPAHLILGLCLARFGGRFRMLAEAFGDPAWAAHLSESERVDGIGETPLEALAQGEHEVEGALPQLRPSEEIRSVVTEGPSGEAETAPGGIPNGSAAPTGTVSGSPPERPSAGVREPLGKKDERSDC